MQYEHRAFLQTYHKRPLMQLGQVVRLLEMHAAMTEGILVPQDSEGVQISEERRTKTALNIAGVLDTFNAVFKDWRSIDEDITRIADEVMASLNPSEEV